MVTRGILCGGGMLLAFLFLSKPAMGAQGEKKCCMSGQQSGAYFSDCRETCDDCSGFEAERVGEYCIGVGNGYYECGGNVGVRCDPIITGFDGKEFHFNDAGDFNLLEEGDGWKVDVTFLGETVSDAGEIKEASWTSSVRVFAPNGDVIEMRLPAIKPSTSKVQMIAMRATDKDKVTVISPTTATVDFEHMSARAVLTDGPEPEVWACIVTTPKMKITIKQMWGEKQALIDPQMESWAIPFTWLNTDFELTQRLAGPVTGILGLTYPTEFIAAQVNLRPEGDASAQASIGGVTEARKLVSIGEGFSLSAGVVGLAPSIP